MYIKSKYLNWLLILPKNNHYKVKEKALRAPHRLRLYDYTDVCMCADFDFGTVNHIDILIVESHLRLYKNADY